ncbi:MAG: exonuclease domain-containing protein [Planctomycetota bacterium]|nr:exonuclease domain-containing protein [Planctomycetota bacterium]
MPYVMVDIEADGPIPGDYSMICFGAIIVEPELNRTFYGQLRPISDRFVPEALAVSGFSREECLKFDDPQRVMERFRTWLEQECGGQARFISDNNGFDWQFINWYFHHFLGSNPFGFSSTNLGSLYKGMQRDVRANFKRMRKTKHTHHPVDDARGNAEAMLEMAGDGVTGGVRIEIVLGLNPLRPIARLHQRLAGF